MTRPTAALLGAAAGAASVVAAAWGWVVLAGRAAYRDEQAANGLHVVQPRRSAT